jgi:hypothetical protein
MNFAKRVLKAVFKFGSDLILLLASLDLDERIAL